MPHNSRLNERSGDPGTKTMADYSCVVAKTISIYLGTIFHPQCILPYRCSCESHSCFRSLHSHHTNGFHCYIHRYLERVSSAMKSYNVKADDHDDGDD